MSAGAAFASSTTRPTWARASVVVALLGLAYAPGALIPYFTADDAGFLWSRHVWRIFAKVIGDGRPILAVIYQAALQPIESINDIVWLRLIYLLLLGAWSVLLLRHLSSRLGPQVSVPVTLLVMCAPGLVEKMALTPSFMTPLCGICAHVAAVGIARSFEDHGRPRAQLALAVAAMVVGWAIYQPIAMVVVGYALIEVLWPPPGVGPRPWPALVRYAVVGVVAVVLYVVLVRAVLPSLVEVEQVGRGTLTRQPLLKVVWFFVMPLRDALNLFWVWPTDSVIDVGLFQADLGLRERLSLGWQALWHPAYAVALVVGVLVCASAWRAAVFLGPRRGRWAAVLMLFLPLAFSLNLLVVSFWPSYRVQVPLYMTVVLLLVAGLRSSHLRETTKQQVLRAVAAAALVTTCATAYGYVASPWRAEWDDLVSQLERIDAGAKTVRVRPATTQQHYGWGVRYDLGRPASAAPWGTMPLTQLAWKELGRAPLDEVVEVGPDEAADVELGRGGRPRTRAARARP